MSPLSRQRGISFGLVAVILLLVVAAFLGMQQVTRLVTASRVETGVPAQFDAAIQALTQYVSTQKRLPCPANPTLDTGEEVLPAPGAATCSFPEGTLPWKTIGLAREISIDPWGQKISYRVYTGAAGSLTQVGGASMVECDTVDASPGAVTAVAASQGGLCPMTTLVTQRSTPPTAFTAGKGYSVSEMGTTKTGIAFVLISHGASGRGAYTTSGVRREMPLGDELVNTGSAGPYVIKAFSASGTDPDSAAHFDDFVAYRAIVDLVKAAGLNARDWPETVSTSVTFDQTTVEAAVGTSVTPGSSVGQVTVNFTGVVANAIDSGGNPVDVTFATAGSYGGIGVAGGGSALVQSSAGEFLRLQVERSDNRFGVTLADFGTYGGQPYWELVEFRFYNNGVEVVNPKYGLPCQPDGGLASFDVIVGATYDQVDITPIPALNTNNGQFNGITAFLLASLKTCPSPATECKTAQWLSTNACTVFYP